MGFFKAVILLHNQLVLVDRIRTMISCYFLNTNRRRKPVSVDFSFWGLLFKVYFKYVKHLLGSKPKAYKMYYENFLKKFFFLFKNNSCALLVYFFSVSFFKYKHMCVCI